MRIVNQILKLMGKVLDELTYLLGDLLQAIGDGLFPPQESDGSYNADFISHRTLLSKYAHGFCLDGKRSLSHELSCRNSLIVGGTGTGKTTCVLTPTCLRARESSLIIHDPSFEIYQATAGYLESEGYVIKVLNFADPASSIRFNVLQRIKSSADINKVASMLIRNTLGYAKGDPFWNLQATGLMALMITILKEQDAQFHNLANLRFLITQFASDPESLDQLFIKARDEATFDEYRAFIAMDQKLLSNITATCKASLTHLADESILQVTATDELDIESFRKQKTALYIANSVMDSQYYSTLTAILLEQFYSMLLGKLPEDDDLHVFFLIDELPTLFMPSLPTAVANVRKARAGIMAICQSISQLHEKYGRHDAEVIRSNCYTQVYFAGQGLETTRELELIMGKAEFEDEDGRTRVRALMTSDEIRTLGDREALLIASNRQPIKLRMTPFYKRWRYQDYSSIPAPSPTRADFSHTRIPIINLERKHA